MQVLGHYPPVTQGVTLLHRRAVAFASDTSPHYPSAVLVTHSHPSGHTHVASTPNPAPNPSPNPIQSSALHKITPHRARQIAYVLVIMHLRLSRSCPGPCGPQFRCVVPTRRAPLHHFAATNWSAADSDRSHETDYVVVGSGIGGELLGVHTFRPALIDP